MDLETRRESTGWKISCLTSVGVKTKLRIDLADFAGHSKFACYVSFHVGTPSTNYRLRIGGYQDSGDRGSRGQLDKRTLE